MKEIIEKLTEWRENIDFDTIQDWVPLGEKLKMTQQSQQLMIAIALLNSIGKNNNIPE